jgi:hypothetical protein
MIRNVVSLAVRLGVFEGLIVVAHWLLPSGSGQDFVVLAAQLLAGDILGVVLWPQGEVATIRRSRSSGSPRGGGSGEQAERLVAGQ